MGHRDGLCVASVLADRQIGKIASNSTPIGNRERVQMASILPNRGISGPGCNDAAMGYIDIPCFLPVLTDGIIPEARHYGPSVIDREVVAIGTVGPEIQMDANTSDQRSLDCLSNLLNEVKPFLAQKSLVHI